MTKQQKRFYIVGPCLMVFSMLSGVGMLVLEHWLKAQQLIAKSAKIAKVDAFEFEGYHFTLPVVIGLVGLIVTTHEFWAWLIDVWQTWRYEVRDKKQKKKAR